MANIICRRLSVRLSGFNKFLSNSNKLLNSSLIYPCSALSEQFQHKNYYRTRPFPLVSTSRTLNINVRYFSKASKETGENEKKPSLFQRFKKMYKEYWYVLVPVHLVTSVAWFGGFYYMAKSGVDIVAILESIHISEKITSRLKDSSMGYVALAYALYKIATPARYTVTLGGTTVAINYLKKWGYIKPVPSAGQLKELYIEKRDNLIETVREKKEDLMSKADKIKDQKDNVIDDLEKGFKKIKETGDKIAKKKNDIVKNINKSFEKDTHK